MEEDTKDTTIVKIKESDLKKKEVMSTISVNKPHASIFLHFTQQRVLKHTFTPITEEAGDI